jgi:catechol 2,3-dioxygenase-like lactoylglutathione lyase family enzyme
MACCTPNTQSSKPASRTEPQSVPPAAVASPLAHIHLHVPDLDMSVAFYRAFFGSNPVKRRPGYAKFLPIWAPVNLALSEQPLIARLGQAVSHLGIQLATPAAVQAHLTRVKASGLNVLEEMGVTCCHSNQDKFWVTDPDGIEWEVYYLNYDVDETTAPTGSSSACCAD